MDEKTIRATLQWGQDSKSLEALKSGAGGVKNALKQVEDQAQKTKQRMNEIRESAERMNMVSQRIAMIGAAVGGPLLLAANKYVSTTKDAESTSREWLASMKQIEQAQIDIGRVVAKEVLPMLKQGADLLSQAADFAEKNPGTVEAVLKFAATATAIGAVGSAVSGIVGTVATLKGLLLGLPAVLAKVGAASTAVSAVLSKSLIPSMAQSAAITARLSTFTGGVIPAIGGVALTGGAMGTGILGTGMTLGTLGAGLTGATLGGGILAGGAAYDYAARNYGLGGGTNLGQFASVGANLMGRLTDALGLTENAARDWFVAVSDATNATDDQTQAALNAANGLNQVATATGGGTSGGRDAEDRNAAIISQIGKNTEAAKKLAADNYARGLEMFQDYSKREVEYQQQYDERRAQMIQDANAEALQAQLDYTEQRGKIITEFGKQQAKEAADFAKNEQQTEDAYYAARLRSARDFGQEVLQAEEDHQRDMRYAAEDYQDQVTELAGQNDAYGLVKAARAYEKERRRKEEEYNVEAARRNKDYAQSLSDEEQAFQKERDQRLAAFQQRRQDAEADNQARLKEFDDNFNAEKAKRATQNQTRLDDLKAQFDKEQKKRADDFKNRLTALDAALTGETEVRRKFYALSAADFKAYLQAIVAGKPYKPSSEFESFLTGKPVSTTTGSGGGLGYTAEAAGGYAYGPGLYLRGEAGYEYTLSNATTRAAEDALGGRITSAALVAALRRNQGGGGLNISLGGISIAGGGSAVEMARLAAEQVFAQLVPVFQRAAAA